MKLQISLLGLLMLLALSNKKGTFGKFDDSHVLFPAFLDLADLLSSMKESMFVKRAVMFFFFFKLINDFRKTLPKR